MTTARKEFRIWLHNLVLFLTLTGAFLTTAPEASAQGGSAATFVTPSSTAGDRVVNLSWYDRGTFSGFACDIYRQAASGAWTLVSSNNSSYALTDTGLTDGVTYTYRVGHTGFNPAVTYSQNGYYSGDTSCTPSDPATLIFSNNDTHALPTLNLANGQTGETSLTIVRSAEYTGPISFSVSGLPTGATGSFNPQTTSDSKTSLTLTLSGSIPSGSYPLTITGASSSTSHSIVVPLRVVSSATQIVPRFSGTVPVSINRDNYIELAGWAISGPGVAAYVMKGDATSHSNGWSVQVLTPPSQTMNPQTGWCTVTAPTTAALGATYSVTLYSYQNHGTGQPPTNATIAFGSGSFVTGSTLGNPKVVQGNTANFGYASTSDTYINYYTPDFQQIQVNDPLGNPVSGWSASFSGDTGNTTGFTVTAPNNATVENGYTVTYTELNNATAPNQIFSWTAAFDVVPPFSGPGLAAWWPFSRDTSSAGVTNVVDSSTNSNNGTVTSTPFNPVAAGTGALFGTGSYLFGSGYIGFPDSASLDFSGQLSVSCWLQVSPVTNGGSVPLYQAPTDTEAVLLHGTLADSNYVGLAIVNGNYQFGSWQAGTFHGASFPVPSLDVGDWSHVVGVYDGQSWNLYRNGSLMNSVPDALGPPQLGTGWNISDPTGAHLFKGAVSDARVFGTALSAIQEQALDSAP